MLKWGLPGRGVKSAKVRPTPYVYYPRVCLRLASTVHTTDARLRPASVSASVSASCLRLNSHWRRQQRRARARAAMGGTSLWSQSCDYHVATRVALNALWIDSYQA